MNRTLLTSACAVLIALVNTIHAQQPDQTAKQLRDVLGPSAVVFDDAVGKELGLSGQQQEKLDELNQTELGRFREFMRKLQSTPADERGGKMQAYHKEAQPRVAEVVNDLLTDEQRARLSQIELQQQGPMVLAREDVAEEVGITNEQRQGIGRIMREVQAAFQSLQREARKSGSPDEVGAKAQKIREDAGAEIIELLTDEQKQKWENLLGERVELSANDNAGNAHPPAGETSRGTDRSRTALARVDVMQRLSVDAVRRQVAGLKKEDVAWREIPWETCLIDGLKRSRDEKKPVMLWIFIDRPIDDERC